MSQSLRQKDKNKKPPKMKEKVKKAHFETIPIKTIEEEKETISNNEICIHNDNDKEHHLLQPEIPQVQLPSPSQEFLLNKLSTDKTNSSIIKGVDKSLKKEFENIKKSIHNDSLAINEKQSNTKEIIPINLPDYSPTFAYNSHLYKDLVKTWKKIQSKISSLEQEKLVQTNDLSSYNLQLKKEHQANILKDRLNSIDKEKKVLFAKSQQLQTQIANILNKEKVITFKEKQVPSMESFQENFVQDTKKVAKKIHHYENESFNRMNKMQNDISQSLEKKTKEILNKEKEENETKIINLKQSNESEKKIHRKRILNIQETYNKIKESINSPSNDKFDPKNISKYAYKKYENSFLKKQENLLCQEKLRRKNYMKCPSKEELDEFAKKINIRHERVLSEGFEKSKDLQGIWRTRKDMLPKDNSQTINIETEPNKNDALISLKKDYHVTQPKINPLLEAERKKRILRLNNPSLTKEEEHQRISSGKCMKKIENNSFKPIKKKSKEMICLSNPNIYNKEREDAELKNVLIKKPRRIIFHSRNNPKKLIPLEKKIDYLSQQQMTHSSTMIPLNSINKKWQTIFNDSSNPLTENLKMIKLKTEMIEVKAQRKEQLLKLNGGLENNHKIAQEYSTLLINSIEGKLCLIEAAAHKNYSIAYSNR